MNVKRSAREIKEMEFAQKKADEAIKRHMDENLELLKLMRVTIEKMVEQQNENTSLLTTIESQAKVIEDLEEERDSIQRDFDSACEISSANSKESLGLYDIVESQKEEIGRLMAVNQHLEIDLVESKAITELAVKGLEEQLQISKFSCSVVNAITIENILSEIERLSHEQNS